jgi:hypothetical protein
MTKDECRKKRQARMIKSATRGFRRIKIRWQIKLAFLCLIKAAHLADAFSKYSGCVLDANGAPHSCRFNVSLFNDSLK